MRASGPSLPVSLCESRLLLKRSVALKMGLGRNRYSIFYVQERAPNLFQSRNERWKVLLAGYIDFLKDFHRLIDCRCGLLEPPSGLPCESRLLSKRSGALKMDLCRNRYSIFYVQERAPYFSLAMKMESSLGWVYRFPERLPSTHLKVLK
ncbi:hypothetical protein CEXT_798621 [Caerostris extrusa]|uniref:Uncharacterized protein n=1 Tax=Caerostris extrusa TaxID=172846 RepID=A0AAV4Q7J6_CAEEX|nr:hypothetical protein CEXT_798621 [Caerostris extrusa]